MSKLIVSLLVSLVLVLPQTVFGAINIERWQTDNGVRVYFVAAPEIPIVDVRAVFSAGSARDADSSGIALMVSDLLTEGAGDLDANRFSERLADTAAEFSAGSLRDMAWVSLRAMVEAPYLDESLELMRQVLARPRFDVAAVDRAKANALVRLKHESQSPASLARNAFYQAIYGNHPYASSISGTPESVVAIDRDELVAFHRRYYTTGNAVITMVGAISRSEAESIAKNLSQDMVAGAAAPAIPNVPNVDEALEKRLEFPSIQSHIRVGQAGMRRGDPDYFPLLVGNHVLGGGGLVSILFDEIREKRGLSYSASSRFSPMAVAGPFAASLQTDNSQQSEALKVLRDELKKFIDHGPSPEALADAKQNLIGGFPLRIDSNAKIVEYLSMIGFYGLSLDYLNEFPARIAEVTVESVKDAFSRRLDPAKMVTVIVGRAEAASKK